MPFQRRYLESHIAEDLDQRMVFVGGPRQVGKTTLVYRFIGLFYRLMCGASITARSSSVMSSM